MQTKICTQCKKRKQLLNFRKYAKMKDGLASQCKICADLGSESWRERNWSKRKHQLLARYKNILNRFQQWKTRHGCKFCDETFAPCLELHHLDPKKKDMNVSDLMSYSWTRVMKESAKCIVVCSTCHTKIHHGVIKL